MIIKHTGKIYKTTIATSDLKTITDEVFSLTLEDARANMTKNGFAMESEMDVEANEAELWSYTPSGDFAAMFQPARAKIIEIKTV